VKSWHSAKGDRAVFYFSFTNNKTKIAQIPTVVGNAANCASRSVPPLGIANVSNSIASAVNMPSTNFIVVFVVFLLTVSAV